MKRSMQVGTVGAALLWLVPGACTDNPPSQVFERDATATGSTTGSGGSGGSTSTGTTGNMAGAAGAPADIPAFCLPEECDGDPDCELTELQEMDVQNCIECLPEKCQDEPECELDPLERLTYDGCIRYEVLCPDQPADVMTELGVGDAIAPGPIVSSTATRPQLTDAEADNVYTIRQYLRAGGDFEVSFSGDGAGGAAGASGFGGAGGEGGAGGPLGVRTLNYAGIDEPPNTGVDNWDPRGPIEDVNKIVPGIIFDPDGEEDEAHGRFTVLGRAITAAGIAVKTVDGVEQKCPRVFIKVVPGTYRGKVIIPAKTSAPPLTIYSTESDASQTVFVAGHSTAAEEGTDIPIASRQQTATFTNSLPSGFHARNLTIVNDYDEGSVNPERDQTAVALLNQGEKALYENVRILGNISPVYVKATERQEAARAYFRDCYIEGDEDIVLGRGTAVFDQCQIHSLGDRVSTGSITAASTMVDNPYGMLFINSEFTADEGVSNVYLGRAWYEGEIDEAVGKVIIRNSILGGHIRQTDPWAPIERSSPKNPALELMVLFTSDDYYAPNRGLVPPEVFLAEFGNSGPGAAE